MVRSSSESQDKIKSVHRHYLCTRLSDNLEKLDRLVEMEDSLLLMKNKLESQILEDKAELSRVDNSYGRRKNSKGHERNGCADDSSGGRGNSNIKKRKEEQMTEND